MDEEDAILDSEDELLEEDLDNEANASDMEDKLDTIIEEETEDLSTGQSRFVDSNETRLNMFKNPKVTVDFLTKFERTRVLGLRIKQLILGASPLIDIQGLNSEKAIAIKELQERKLPFIVRRYISKNPDKFEDWRLADLRLEQ